MKKNFVYAILSAIALSGAAGFAGCSSSDEIIDNPNYNPETNSVKTQFTISFQGNFTKTRQSADVVQQAQTVASFRGMENIVLYPFAKESVVNSDPIASTDTKLGDAIELKSVLKPTETNLSSDPNTIPKDATPANSLVGTSNSVLFNDVSVPVGTGSFLFYGKAKDETGGKVVNGSLTPSYTGTTAGDITFSPEQIYPSGTTASTVGTALATYLTNIARATNWAECADDNNSNQTWYNSGLGALYSKFIMLKAGSSKSVQIAVQDLYTSIRSNTDDVSTAIKTAILNSTYASDPDTNNDSKPDGKLVFTSAVGNSDDTYFPGDVGLPDGAALLTYTESSKTFAQTIDGNGNLQSNMTAAFDKYVYPASLYYYCNSGIKTSNSSQKDAYDGTNTWALILDGYNLTAVGPATRSVAILDQIQYGVGRLDTRVKAGAATLYDKKGEPHTVDATNNFTLTGILIGGQKQVKYDFTTNTTGTAYTIYDNITKSNTSLSPASFSTDYSGYNYTLALETATTASVFVAVELLNNGDYFEGADGVVPTGGKFYLVAELKPGTTGDNPSGKGGTITNTNGLTQVFKQDYKTIANFTIPAGYPSDDTHFDATNGNTIGLGKAYNTIPDLRAPEMELGLSVDLEWVSGIQFDIDLGQ